MDAEASDGDVFLRGEEFYRAKTINEQLAMLDLSHKVHASNAKHVDAS